MNTICARCTESSTSELNGRLAIKQAPPGLPGQAFPITPCESKCEVTTWGEQNKAVMTCFRTSMDFEHILTEATAVLSVCTMQVLT